MRWRRLIRQWARVLPVAQIPVIFTGLILQALDRVCMEKTLIHGIQHACSRTTILSRAVYSRRQNIPGSPCFTAEFCFSLPSTTVLVHHYGNAFTSPPRQYARCALLHQIQVMYLPHLPAKHDTELRHANTEQEMLAVVFGARAVAHLCVWS